MSAELAAAGGASAVLYESLSALETIAAAGAEGAMVGRWADRQISWENAGLRRLYLNLNLRTLMGLANSLGTTAVFLVAGKEVLDQRMTIGMFSAFLSLQTLFMAPLGSLLEAYGQLQYLGSHLARLDDVMQSEPEPTGHRDAKELKGQITLEKVCFSFDPNGPPVVEDICLEIRAGEKIALVGPTGAGKSTLARLMLGMHIPSQGEIRFDGVDLRAFNLGKLRNRMGVVLQDTFLLDDTVRANLSLNDPGLPLQRLQETARIACIDGVIEALHEGYDTVIGENGRTLSGGQRQRLSLARALAHDPSILLLDEATSALDLETEVNVHANLDNLGCTRIIIAHRLATVMDADRIFVMDHGRIVQAGSYPELRSRPGLFAALVDSAESGLA
jgi:ABC-type bacteriocin/lantibiotic exporter with double-glycine peptidase domain